MCCRTLVVWHKIVIKILKHHDLYDIYWKKLQTYRIFLILHILHQSYFDNSAHVMDDFRNRVRLWCFRIFICIFIQITLTNLHVVRSCVYVFYMLYFWTRLSHRIVAAICSRFDVRILFNMKYMSSLGNLFGQEMQSNHEMDFTNFLLTAYLTLKLTEKLFQSVYIK